MEVEPAGNGDPSLPLLHFQPKGFIAVKPDKALGFILTRRQFLAACGTAAALAALPTLPGCGGGSSSTDEAPGLFVYRLSSRGKRASNASKKHNANMLFATWEAADANRAHPGDRSRIVRVNISPLRYRQLFTLPGSTVTDLRHV